MSFQSLLVACSFSETFNLLVTPHPCLLKAAFVMSDSINVFCTITAKNGERIPLALSTSSTATQIRHKVAEATKIPLDQLRLIFRGKMIKDDDSTSAVSAYKLEPDCVLHCMGKPSEDSTPAAAATVSVAAAAPSTSSSAATAAVPSIPPAAAAAMAAVPVVDPLQTALQTLRTSNSPQVYETALSTLAKILSNISDHPMEEKYRKVKLQNVAFQKRLGGLNGGDAAMKAVGFLVEQQEGVPVYQLHASPEAWPKLMAAKATIDAAATEAKRALASPLPSSSSSSSSNNNNNNNNMFGAPGVAGGGAANPFMMGGGGMPGMMGGAAGMPDMNDPNMRAVMANMMSNPEALRSMLQNPMVQQMIQNDPNVSPMLRTSMQQLASNPAMLNQLSAMMSDPSTRARMESMMGNAMAGGGGMPGMGSMMPPGMPSAAANNNSGAATNNSNNNNAASDQEQTEDEMIAEAIRRSLEES